MAVVRPGHVLFEIAGCSLSLAREALGLADAKLPFRCRLVTRERISIRIYFMKMSEIKEFSLPEIQKKIRELGEELLQLQLRKQTGQVEKASHMIKSLRRDRARLFTQLRTSSDSQKKS